MPGNRTTSRLRPWLVFFGFNVPTMNRPPANLARPITGDDKGKNREDSWSSGNRRESTEVGKPTKIEQRDVGLQAKMPSQHDTRRNTHDVCLGAVAKRPSAPRPPPISVNSMSVREEAVPSCCMPGGRHRDQTGHEWFDQLFPPRSLGFHQHPHQCQRGEGRRPGLLSLWGNLYEHRYRQCRL